MARTSLFTKDCAQIAPLRYGFFLTVLFLAEILSGSVPVSVSKKCRSLSVLKQISKLYLKQY